MKTLFKLLVLSLAMMIIFIGCKGDKQSPTQPNTSAENLISGISSSRGGSETSVPPVTTPGTPTTTTPTPVPTTPTNSGNATIFDPLTNGTSKATSIGGGEFTAEGYHFTSHFGYIIYDTQIKGNFRVEFDTKGFQPGEMYHAPDDQATILFMQDAPLGTDWTQWRIIPNCLFQMIKLAYYPGGNSTDQMKVKGACGDGGEGYELWSYQAGPGGRWLAGWMSWDPDKKYHWVVTVRNGHVETFMDGVQLYYGDGFQPGDPIRFFFGGTGGGFGEVTPDDSTYSNIKIFQE